MLCIYEIMNQNFFSGEYLALTGERLDLTDMIMTSLVRSPIDSKVSVFCVFGIIFCLCKFVETFWLPTLCPE
jgi:hypothetical protein